MIDKTGGKLNIGDYVEACFTANSLVRRNIPNRYGFKRTKRYGVIEKICPKTAKIRYFDGKVQYMYDNEIRKMSDEEAMFYTLQTAEKIG